MSDEFERYKATYKKHDVSAVQEVQEQGWLVEVFARCWKNKFKSMPIFPVSNAHITQMKDFRKAVGPKAAELIEHYFTMKDDWFIKQAYSLDCLVRNANRVLASHSSGAAARELFGKVYTHLYCGACGAKTFKHFPANFNYDLPFRCDKCTSLNAKFIYPTKQERYEAIIMIGGAMRSL